MLTFLKKEGKENIVLFVHGFKGGKETWMTENKPSNFIQYLLDEEKINGNFDFAIFDYFTKVTDAFQIVSFIRKLRDSSVRMKKNLSIDDLSDLLQSEVDITLEKYKKIVLVGHSMGGLVSKAYILKALKNKSKISLYVSIAVPHNGTKLADLAKIVFNSPQLDDLKPLQEHNHIITQTWINSRNELPRTIYHQGKLDTIVPKTSAVGFDPRPDLEVVYSNHDHTSIIRPKSPYDVVVASTSKALIALVESPVQTKEKQNLQTNKLKKMEPVSSSIMVGSIVGYLTKKLKDNKSISDFLNEFTDATVNWISPVFLKDEKPKEVLQELIDDPIDEKGFNQKGLINAIERALSKDDKGLSYIEEMYQVIQSKAEDGEDVGSGNTMNITGDGNVGIQDVKGSSITVNNNSSSKDPK